MAAAMAVGSGTFMAVAMAPSAIFTLRLQHRLGADGAAVAGFVLGYLASWTIAGAAVMLALDAPPRAAFAVPLGLGAAAYQVSPVAQRSLARCRSPLGLLLSNWQPGPRGAVRLGAVYGGWCIRCCAGLMVAIVVLGISGVFGMVAMGLIALAEKRAPSGVALSRLAALAVAVAAIGVLA